MEKATDKGLKDGELLRAFRVHADQNAFQELTRRHSRMILETARSVFGGDSNHAEDVVQLVFVILVEKASKLENYVSVGPWLHVVALRLAQRERLRESRRKELEREAAMRATMQSDLPPVGSESALKVLHEELCSLSTKHRESIILHYFEGLRYEEAASRVGCTSETFGMRLKRARDALHKRLIKRGVEWGTSAFVAALGKSVSAAEFPPEFIAATAKAATLYAAGKPIPASLVSPEVVAMVERGRKWLFWAKVKNVVASVMLLAGVGAGGFAAYQALVPAAALQAPVPAAALPLGPPSGMALIPKGTNKGVDLDTQKPYSLTVEAFMMDRCEVTKALWDEVAAWGREHGYEFGMLANDKVEAGQGKAPDHPVHSVTWHDCVIWCNARSERDGFTPVYYADAAYRKVTRRGGRQGPFVKVTADGYRLPTLVEWQYAARGGEPSHRFPWHDVETVGHSRANYHSEPDLSWDTGPTQGYHPTYAVEPKPYTSPVGAFAPNAYGLYDMVGNISEWCFDDAGDSWKKYTGSSWTIPSPSLLWSEEALEFSSRANLGFRTVRTPRTSSATGKASETP